MNQQRRRYEFEAIPWCCLGGLKQQPETAQLVWGVWSSKLRTEVSDWVSESLKEQADRVSERAESSEQWDGSEWEQRAESREQQEAHARSGYFIRNVETGNFGLKWNRFSVLEAWSDIRDR